MLLLQQRERLFGIDQSIGKEVAFACHRQRVLLDSGARISLRRASESVRGLRELVNGLLAWQSRSLTEQRIGFLIEFFRTRLIMRFSPGHKADHAIGRFFGDATNPHGLLVNGFGRPGQLALWIRRWLGKQRSRTVDRATAEGLAAGSDEQHRHEQHHLAKLPGHMATARVEDGRSNGEMELRVAVRQWAVRRWAVRRWQSVLQSGLLWAIAVRLIFRFRHPCP